ncbi:MAG: hypothetical protein ACI3YC_01990, partial [Alloprevotella sp.]
LLFALAALLVSCAGNDLAADPGAVPAGHSVIDLSVGTNHVQSSGRADDPNATSGELMKKGFVVMVKTIEADGTAIASPTIDHIIKIDIDETNNNTAVERKQLMQITTENGTYDFYSFVNINYSSTNFTGTGAIANELSEATLNYEVGGATQTVTFTRGAALPENLSTLTYPCSFNQFQVINEGEAGFASYAGIPMSNKETYVVDNNRTITLQVVRMLSKMKLYFTNKTGKPVWIKKLELGNITANDSTADSKPSLMYLLPPKTDNNLVAVSFPAAHRTSNFIYYQAGAADAVEVGKDATTTADAVNLPTNYFNASISDHPTARFPLYLTLERGKTATSALGDAENMTETRFAYMQVTTIPRNSMPLVNIAITDYVLHLEAFMHAPIGGYPDFKLTEHNENYYAEFEGAGEFTLIPHVYAFDDRDNPENWFSITDKSHIQSYTLTVGGDTGIFSEQPHFDVNTGEILGTLNGTTTGTASVQLSLQIITSAPGADPVVTQVYNRTIYLIAK